MNQSREQFSSAERLRVLILEDSPDDARLMVRELEQAGFPLDWTRVDSEEAFRTALGADWDIILADYSLPQFDGLRALQIIREQEREIPVIIVTGALGDEKAAECVRQGAADYLLKDRLARLSTAVIRAREQHQERTRRKAAEAELRRSYAELEQRVRERTAELMMVNEQLRQEIAERQRVEAALRTSEARYRTLTESSPDIIFIIGADGHLQYINTAGARAFGRDPAELCGRSLSELLPPEVAERDWHNIRRVLLSGEACYVQNSTPLAGRCLELNTWLVPLKDNEDRVNAVFGIARDVTEIQRLNADLQQRENQLRLILKQLPVLLWTTDRDFRILSAFGSPATDQGLKSVFLPGISLRQALEPFGSALEVIIAAHNALRGNSGSCEFHWQNSDYEVRVEPLRNLEGEITGTIAMALDITSRRHLEQELRISRENYRNLFDYVPIGIYRSTPAGQILMANRALLKMLNYPSFYELSLRNLEQEGFEPGSSRQEFKKEIERYGEIRQREAVWLRRDGSRLFVRENARAIRDESGRTLFYEGTVEDITESLCRERHLLRLNALLRTIRFIGRDGGQERLAFLRGICHELVSHEGYYGAAVFSFQPAGAMLETAAPAAWWEELKKSRLPALVTETMTEGVMIQQDFPRRSGCWSAAVRIEYQRQPCGVLLVTNPAQFSFEPDEKELLREIARAVGQIWYSQRPPSGADCG